jgi:chromosome segregation ATPase
MTRPDRIDDLADRVLALEQQQRADRRAIGSLDADVSDLQAQRRQDVRLLQSLRTTQLEQGERLGRVESGLGRLESRLDRVDSRLDRVDSRLDGIDGRLDGVDSRLGRVESATSAGFAAVDARLDVIVELLGGAPG